MRTSLLKKFLLNQQRNQASCQNESKKETCLSFEVDIIIDKKEKSDFFSFFILKDTCFKFLHIGIHYLNQLFYNYQSYILYCVYYFQSLSSQFPSPLHFKHFPNIKDSNLPLRESLHTPLQRKLNFMRCLSRIDNDHLFFSCFVINKASFQ